MWGSRRIMYCDDDEEEDEEGDHVGEDDAR